MRGNAGNTSAAIILFGLLSACAHLHVAATAPSITYIDRDTTWSGEVRVEGIVHVRKSATLTLLPSTRVVFAKETFSNPDEHEGFSAPGIHVEGRIVAEGTGGAPIVFTSASQPAMPGSWDKILFSFSSGSRFSNCIFEGARYAFHAHFSEISIRKCIFRANDEGVRLGVSRVTLEDSVFTRNEIRGINFRECRNVIRRNLVYGNGDGVFLHSKNSASVVRENAIYDNRNFNARMGDLHSDDIDLSGNWWGTSSEEEARATVYDGRNQSGLGKILLSPVLARPPVTGAAIRGVFVAGSDPVKGADVRAYGSLTDGVFGDGHVASSMTDENGSFLLSLPPGRYFVSGRAEASGGMLFALPGNNPVVVAYGETREMGLPAVSAPPKGRYRPSADARSSIVARATLMGRPEIAVAVHAFRPDAPDFRGAGEASALTDEEGIARLFLTPGKYLVSARKRVTGAAIGMVDEGGLFGVYPYFPVDLPGGSVLSMEIPMFRKRGLLGEDDRKAPAAEAAAQAEGTATLSGEAAGGYIVFFYSPPETIGRPLARSSVVSRSGRFSVHLPGDGEYIAYIRRAVEGVPGGAAEERLGPVSVRLAGGRFLPGTLAFGPQGR
ncbi:MAG: hypothetical protein HW377_1438 [Actinobacteria bacterium]|nr:hypothetical protein [Actinomycetota bacterium]